MTTVTENDTLSLLSRALPREFPFYHLGRVELQKESATRPELADLLELESGNVIGIQLEGDVRGLMLVFIDIALDLSTYMEMGNILASQLVTHLGNEDGLDVMISPPKLLNENQTRLISQASQQEGATEGIFRTYYHRYKDQVVPVRTVILPARSEGAAGYA